MTQAFKFKTPSLKLLGDKLSVIVLQSDHTKPNKMNLFLPTPGSDVLTQQRKQRRVENVFENSRVS